MRIYLAALVLLFLWPMCPEPMRRQFSHMAAYLAGPANLMGGASPPSFAPIIPGAGWSGPTSEPPQVGVSGKFFAERVIARFATVNSLDWTSGTFYVAVKAWMGVDVSDTLPDVEKVEFAAEQGAWTEVTTRQLNPSTGDYEFVAVMNPANYTTDGTVEIRARIYPKTAGFCRVLSGLLVRVGVNGSFSFPGPFWVDPAGNDANPGTEASPVATIGKAVSLLNGAGGVGGGTIYLKTSETHTLAEGAGGWAQYYTTTRYCTVRPAPGLTQANVRINAQGTNGIRTTFFRLFDVRMKTSGDNFQLGADGDNVNVYLENVDLEGPGTGSPTQFGFVFRGNTGGSTTCHWVGGKLHDSVMGFATAEGATQVVQTLARNVEVFNISEDAISSCAVVTQCFIHDVAQFGTSNHPDVFVQRVGNAILENTRAIDTTGAQGIYPFPVTGLTGWAIVNCVVDAGNSWNDAVPIHHVLFYHVTIIGFWRFREWPASEYSGVCFRGIIANSIGSQEPQGSDPGSPCDQAVTTAECEAFGAYRSNQSAVAGGSPCGPSTLGTDWQIGDPLYVNVATNDFHLQAGSPCKGRLVPMIPVDIEGTVRSLTAASCGAYE